MPGPWRVRAGDTFAVDVINSNAGLLLFGRANIVYDNGMDDVLYISEYDPLDTRVLETIRSGNHAKMDGWVHDAQIDARGPGPVKRGQCHITMGVHRQNLTGTSIGRGYLYSGHGVSSGVYEEAGPGGGGGWLRWEEVFHNRAGNAVAVVFSLAAANALRKVYGLVWYYHCDGNVGTRVFNTPGVYNLGGAKPTGFTTTGENALYYYPGAGITLTVNEEGAIISLSSEGKDGRGVSNDNGTQTVESSTTEPTPWPLLVTEDDLSIIRFPVVTDGLAGDTHSAYVLMEEWLVL